MTSNSRCILIPGGVWLGVMSPGRVIAVEMTLGDKGREGGQKIGFLG